MKKPAGQGELSVRAGWEEVAPAMRRDQERAGGLPPQTYGGGRVRKPANVRRF